MKKGFKSEISAKVPLDEKTEGKMDKIPPDPPLEKGGKPAFDFITASFNKRFPLNRFRPIKLLVERNTTYSEEVRSPKIFFGIQVTIWGKNFETVAPGCS